ncbi:sporulation histidine kinase inhibitor Sda [Evansella sp. AB-P1]|nr:sporulation histidine kinase inhibitor Sda [Evansella sp. AB-P1]MDG5788380.1 sporulation histidine kinase inhibitor Sda [Evansella sp. AB-P1]
MHRLSNAMLIESYIKAKKLEVSDEFLSLLIKEMEKRNIHFDHKD